MTEHLTVNKFLGDCYNWLYQPQNRCVEAFHYDTCEASNSKDIDELVHNKEVRQMVRAFLGQRLRHGEGILPSDMPRWFMSKAITQYIQNMYK